MISKNHKQNSNFQIVYFLIGSCHTPDAAYSLLCDLREERQMAIDNYKVQQLKNQAKRIRAERLLQSKDEAKRLEGQAKLMELENNEKYGKVLYEAAVNELDFINKCIEKIQPLRKYKDLPDIEAHEAAQYEEWKLELIRRAENYLLTTGTIPPDQFDTMRMHPAFKKEILPKIKEMVEMLKTPDGQLKLQERISEHPFKEVVKLLKAPK
ncbi:MAG: hypothetical protein ACPL1B_08115 [Thermoprotei archaeon]